MADNRSPNRHQDETRRGRAPREKLFKLTWTYLRGWVVVVALVLLAKAISEAYSRVSEWLEPLLAQFESAAPNIAMAVAILILVPWAVGWVIDLILLGRLFRKQRGLRAFRRMESRLTTELRPDPAQGYRVAVTDFPNAKIRALCVIGATFPEPETGRELAAVYLPGTPDPTKGSMRVVAVDDLTLTDWNLSDLTRFHLTFGSASPDSLRAEEAEGPSDPPAPREAEPDGSS